MENEKILILAKAGYNRAEINEILNPPTVQPPAMQEIQPVVEAHEETAPPEGGKKNDYSEVLKKIENLEQRMFKENVQNSEIKQSPKDFTLNEITAQLLR